MYYAIFKHPNYNENKKFLVAGFRYIDERNTFAKYSEFEVLPADKRRAMKKDRIMNLCLANERIVFDQNGKPVTRINNLYKSIVQQKTDRPEDSHIPCMPRANRNHMINATMRHRKTKL